MEKDRPSKSQKKRYATYLQQLGEALVKVPKSDIETLELPESLEDAILFAQTITKHGAKKRQMQYIGSLMRKMDPAPIEAALETLTNARKRPVSPKQPQPPLSPLQDH